jgi:hypothetical protein
LNIAKVDGIVSSPYPYVERESPKSTTGERKLQ